MDVWHLSGYCCIRWCMVYADEVVYGWHLVFFRSAAAAAAPAFRLALERALVGLHSRRAVHSSRRTGGGGKCTGNGIIVVGRWLWVWRQVVYGVC